MSYSCYTSVFSQGLHFIPFPAETLKTFAFKIDALYWKAGRKLVFETNFIACETRKRTVFKSNFIQLMFKKRINIS